jgi:glutamyl-tRNA reductase
MTSPTGVVTSVQVAHDEATLSEIEAAGVENPQRVIESLLDRPGVQEAFFLQTCHRVECYVVTPHREAAKAALQAVIEPGAQARYLNHDESLRHLLKVTAGLESMVLGEDQILGQVREAAEDAKAVNALGPLLETVVMKAIHVGERARSETAINEGAISLGSAAVSFAGRCTDLSESTAVVLGAGEMGRIAAKCLAEEVPELRILNRSPEGPARIAAALPDDVSAQVDPLEALPDSLSDADLAVTATASDDPVVTGSQLAAVEDLVIVDLAQPRDVDPDASADGVEVYDLDDVEVVTNRTQDQRLEAAQAVTEMAEAELANLREQLKRARADDVIAAMYESAEAAKRREVRSALNRMQAHGDLTEEQTETVEDLADALVNQLLAAPTRSLRDAAAEDDWETIDTALRLFDPSFDEGSPFPTGENATPPDEVRSDSGDE